MNKRIPNSFTILILQILFSFLISCKIQQNLSIPVRTENSISGTQFYKSVFTKTREEREILAKKEILNGNIPAFLKKFVAVHVFIISPSGKKIKATYWVLPDYLSIGKNEDFARIPLTPSTAQVIADSLHCFLPTKKIVDDIYKAAKIKLEPVPMYAFRDSAVTMYQHNLIIEGQRKLKKGLIAGIKKDVIITSKLIGTSHKVAIYGWHKTDGGPIQQVYTGHADWYVDYSHGIRLIYQTILVNKKPMNFRDILNDPILKKLLCDEDNCTFYHY
ncbi:MAG: hypothetical protein ACMG51_03405 [Ginsengibacter sp.]